jgi:hypothetical protein
MPIIIDRMLSDTIVYDNVISPTSNVKEMAISYQNEIDSYKNKHCKLLIIYVKRSLDLIKKSVENRMKNPEEKYRKNYDEDNLEFNQTLMDYFDKIVHLLSIDNSSLYIIENNQTIDHAYKQISKIYDDLQSFNN